ncbi:MAG: sigma-54-dependent Fis family transcriptional regulator [Nitrospinae bacterium]|nr:sigma-54-dependent Fis family transcriptional regulator [Nitrospinota bacterium]
MGFGVGGDDLVAGATALIVDDDEIILSVFSEVMKKSGLECLTAPTGAQAMDMLGKLKIDVVLADYMMPNMTGLELLQQVRERFGDVPFIILTGYASVDNAVACMRYGAYDYIQKPCDPQRVLTTIQRSLSHFKLSEQNKKLKSQLMDKFSFQNIITNAPAMMEALRLAERVAKTPAVTVAIYGESGVGKEVLARAIHSAGETVENNFVAVNCAGIPANLLESELFGHAKGAFTGADRDRPGKFDAARNGTLLLDEIGDMPLDLQAKLLRTLQERTYERLGSNKPIKAEFRLIVATNRNLQELSRTGDFREDLFHRVNTFPIHLPPLRERQEDIPALCHHFLDQFRSQFGKVLPGISENAMELMVHYPWPGNIRELRNCVERAAILTDDELIQPEHLIINESQGMGNPGTSHVPGAEDGVFRLNLSIPKENISLDSIINNVLLETLTKCGNNKSRAAELLKVDRGIFYRRTS